MVPYVGQNDAGVKRNARFGMLMVRWRMRAWGVAGKVKPENPGMRRFSCMIVDSKTEL